MPYAVLALAGALAAYTAFDLAACVAATRGRARLAWLACGAVSLGAALTLARSAAIRAWPVPWLSLAGGVLFGAVLLAAAGRAQGPDRAESARRRWSKPAAAILMGAAMALASPAGSLAPAAASGALLAVVLLVCWIARLRERNSQLDALFERLPKAAALAAADDRVVRVNQAFTRVFGYGQPASAGQRLADLMIPAEFQDEYRVRTGLALQGRRSDYEIVALHLDGSPIPVMLTHTPVPSARGPLVCTFFRDERSRRRDEEARQAAEGLWRAVFDTSAVGISVTNAAGRYTAANCAFQNMVGYSEAELCAMSYIDLTCEEDRPANQLLYRELHAGQRTSFRIEKRYRSKDGRLIWVRNTVSTGHVAPDLPPFAMSIVEDITEARVAEERLRQYQKVVESSEDMIVVSDRQHRHLIANRAFLDFRGLPREQVVGHFAADFTGADSLALIESKLDQCFQGQVVKFEMKCPHGPLGERDLSASYFPIEGPHGVDLVACILRDVTAQKRAAAELHGSFAQLRALTAQLQSVREEERTTLARELHDELGQSLTAIRIDLASLKTVADERRRAGRIDSLMNLVDETIRSVRRISTELRPGILDDLGLAAAVEWAAEEFQSRTGILCRVALPAAPLAVDPSRATALFRIVQETLTNVARHAGATYVRIHLSQENGRLPLVIHDNGRGITAAEIAAPHALGILGMRERARLLGGEFSISGQPGEGTTVRVSIPRFDHRAEAAV